MRREEKERGKKAIISVFDEKFVQMFKDTKIFGKLLFYPQRLVTSLRLTPISQFRNVTPC